MNNKELESKISYLFNRSWEENLSDAEEELLDNVSKDLISHYGWNAVYESTIVYLHTECLSPTSVINFASNYWTYGWYEYPIVDPHSFLGYLYYRVNFDTQQWDPMNILDSLATTILQKAGFIEADLFINPSYMPENDPKIIAAANSFRKNNL